MNRNGFIGLIVWVIILFLVITALIFALSTHDQTDSETKPAQAQQTVDSLGAQASPSKLTLIIIDSSQLIFAEESNH